jgi:alkanesulfonate monooxygenase SsuD/methylene tetrahydromethanopterin reductase-like flavin-dependent oxidoreductase (luciferase family)
MFLAGIGPKMTSISKKLFQGYIGHVVCSKPHIKDNILPILGKKNAHHTVSSIILCSINKDKRKAVLDAKGTIAFYSTVKAYSKPFIDLGFEENIERIRKAFFQNDTEGMIDNVSDEMVKNFAIYGNRDDVKDQLNDYKEILDLPILSAPHYYLDKSLIESYQDEILENFRI